MVGGVGYTPELLQEMIDDLKEGLVDKNAPFGVDLLLPKIGGGYKPTTTHQGRAAALLDVIINSGAKLFVCAIGVPPTWMVERLRKAGIVAQNMIGSPKQWQALAAGVDVTVRRARAAATRERLRRASSSPPSPTCAAGGARRSPAVRCCRRGGRHFRRPRSRRRSRSAPAVWVGTRFVASVEGDAPDTHKEAVVTAGYHDTIRTLVFLGRLMRIKKNAYDATSRTQRPAHRPASPLTLHTHPAPPARLQVRDELGGGARRGDEVSAQEGQAAVQSSTRSAAAGRPSTSATPWLMGQIAGAVHEIKPAAEIVNEMVRRGRHRARQRRARREVVARIAYQAGNEFCRALAL